MNRRNVEEPHAFSREVAEACGIYEMGGLLMDAGGGFTAAVEAYESEESRFPKGTHFADLLRMEGHYENVCKECLLARHLGVPLYIFFRMRDKTHTIYQYQLELEESEGKEKLISPQRVDLTEEEFLAWWRAHKQTEQAKGYRDPFKQRASDSYFDQLLEGAMLKWGGNIDGFVVSRGEDPAVSAIIEARYTTNRPLADYDPAKYYAQDIYTWLPLILLRKKLNVPLFLFTFSRRPGEEHQVGLAQVMNEPEETSFLRYGKADPLNRRNGRPYGRIVDSAADVRSWLAARLGETGHSL